MTFGSIVSALAGVVLSGEFKSLAPLVVHAVTCAESSVDSKNKMPLSGPTKLQLATELLHKGVDALGAGGGFMEEAPQQIGALVDAANAMVRAGDAMSTAHVQSGEVEPRPLHQVDDARSAVKVGAVSPGRAPLLR